jgi:hypothetical protein
VWAHNKNAKRQHEIVITTAWLTAGFHRQRRLKALAMILRPNARVVTGEEKARLQAAHDEMIRAMG